MPIACPITGKACAITGKACAITGKACAITGKAHPTLGAEAIILHSSFSILMTVVPRTQIIPFTVLAGQTLDLSARTKYNHSKVVGVVLLPDRNIFGDEIYLEINKQVILPYGFNAGLISFQPFLNRELKNSVYLFEEWAKGNEVRIVYNSNGHQTVNIDLMLLTEMDNETPITRRKKLQIVPVLLYNLAAWAFTEPVEIRTKTDFYYDELIGVFIDFFSQKDTKPIFGYDTEPYLIVADFLKLLDRPLANSAEEKDEKRKISEELMARIAKMIWVGFDGVKIKDIIQTALTDYLDGETPETPEPYVKNADLTSLQESIQSYSVYDDLGRRNSTFELTVGGQPFYPENYPIAAITPRYRKTFKELMYHTSMQVQEADIFIRFDTHGEQQSETDRFYPFSTYFMYHQKAKN
jgi:hypothetical protein